MPDLRECLGNTGALHAPGLPVLSHVGEQLVLGLGAHHARVSQLGVEAEGVIKLKVERTHDGSGEIDKLLVARDLDLPDDLGLVLKSDPENVG